MRVCVCGGGGGGGGRGGCQLGGISPPPSIPVYYSGDFLDAATLIMYPISQQNII